MNEPNFSGASELIQSHPNMEPRKVAAKVSQLDSRFTYIDHGMHRIVFKIKNPVYSNVILKIARFKDGIQANKKEYENYNALKHTEYADWLCPVDSILDDNTYLFMDEVNMSDGDYVPVIENLTQIFSTDEISSQNVGKHSHLGDVLVDYTFEIL